MKYFKRIYSTTEENENAEQNVRSAKSNVLNKVKHSLYITSKNLKFIARSIPHEGF
jgi:hypothetical protein